MKPIQILLQRQFPRLFFARDADQWLSIIEGEEVMNQIRTRNISGVKIVPMIRSGGLYINKDRSLTVWLNDIYSPERTAELLGCEIGRTFFFFDDPLQDEPALKKTFERFCNVFSQYWLAKNNRIEIIERCRNQKQLVTQCIFN